MFDDRFWNPVRAVLCLVGILCGAPVAGAVGKLAFAAGEKGAYTFDTGLLRGALCAKGRSSGLTSVVHVPSGTRLDGGSGICGYYRLFTTNKRYGSMAWDWPGQSRLLSDGAVEITLPAAEDRPFEMIAVYRWSDPATLDLETTVRAREDLPKFEVFLASYFHKSLASPYVCAQSGFLLAEKSHGDWLMFPREKALAPVIQDGRWEKEPHPVKWTIMPEFKAPLIFRRGTDLAPTVVLMAPPADCFAVSMPYQAESHYSLYLSLFGGDVKAGETVRGRTRFVVTTNDADREVLGLYRDYAKKLGVSGGD